MRVAALLFALMPFGCNVEPDGNAEPYTALPNDNDTGGSDPGTGGSGGGSVEEHVFGDLPVVQLDGGDCTAMAAESVELYGVDQAPLYPDRLVAVDGGYAAASSIDDAVVTFDADGGDASDTLGWGESLHRLAKQGDGFAVAAIDSKDHVAVRRFDAQGGNVGDKTTVADETAEALAFAVGPAGMLVGWSLDGFVHVRTLDDQANPVADQADLNDLPVLDGVSLAATATADGYALAYAGGEQDGWWIRFAPVAADGSAGEPVDVVRTDVPIRIVDFEATSDGYVLYVASMVPSLKSYLMRLDAQGHAVGSVVELLDIYPGWDLAVSDDAIAMVAARQDGPPAMRVFDHQLNALDSWVCLAPAGDIDLPAAIDVNGDGFVVAYPGTPDDNGSPSLLFAALDASGQPM